MHTHHAGDGCQGESRPLSPQDCEAIGKYMGRMMLDVVREDMAAVLKSGSWIGVHYGPKGEWHLALRLATQITGLAPAEHCDQDGMPLLTRAVPLDDSRVQIMAHHCIAMFPEARQHQRADVDKALALAAPLVEQFVHYFKQDRKPEALEGWEFMYEVTEPHMTTEAVMRAGACSALLMCWAARYSVQAIP